MRPSAVLFDCDGVIVDSEPITDRVIAANLARYGLVMKVAEIHGMFLGGRGPAHGRGPTRKLGGGCV